MSGDLLDGGRPKRLILRQGRWFLEVSRLVSVGDGVFQPRTQRVEGRAAIVDVLRRSKQGRSLAEPAARLVGVAEPAGDASYDVVDGTWAPSSLAPSYIKQLAKGDTRTATEAALLAELTLLRAAHEGLMARVGRLERAVAGTSGLDLGEEPAPGARPDASQGAGPAPPGDPHAAPEPESSPVAAPSDEVAGSHGTAGPHLRLPGIQSITATLKVFCGEEVPLEEAAAAAPEWLTAPGRYCASWLVDDDGHEVGAILCDVEAVVRLGGSRLMLPPEEVDSQASQQAPTDEVLAATSEVCASLTNPINELPGNLHVRAAPLERLDDLMPEWMRTPYESFVCEHPGGGVVALLVR